ncbi:Heterogeneous nuclear ribonucleoproteins C1/C2-like [Aphelenchoides besseyi]|nr:Heterogeneous nuclear ribonucleoproteins C1/C2-like [Aphelenchoides besseyi]
MFDSVEIPPNAKYEPQSPTSVTGNTLSKDFEKSRVFVACLNTNLCTRKDVIQLFSMYGQVVGVSHFAREGYAFVQFANESDAVDAVKNLHHWMFQGCVKIDTPHDLVNREPGQSAIKRPTNYPQHLQGAKVPRLDPQNELQQQSYFPTAHSSRGRAEDLGSRGVSSAPIRGKFGAYNVASKRYSNLDSDEHPSYFGRYNNANPREQTRYSGYKDEYNYPQTDDYNQQYAEDYDPYAYSSYQYDPNEQSADYLNGIPDFDSADHLEYESYDYEQEEPQSQQPTFQPKKRVPLTAPKADFVQKKLDPTKRAISTAQNETGVVHENYAIPDMFICGGCHMMTANVRYFIQHRSKPCPIKQVEKGEEEPRVLKCHMCAVTCQNGWDLVSHMGKKHCIYLFNETHLATN